MSEIVAILGSRPKYKPSYKKVRDYVKGLPPGTILVSGGADGVDTWAEQVAREAGMGVVVFGVTKDEWATSRGAGFSRTDRLLSFIKQNEGRVVAFLAEGSPGTSYTIERCKEMGIPLEVRDGS